MRFAVIVLMVCGVAYGQETGTAGEHTAAALVNGPVPQKVAAARVEEGKFSYLYRAGMMCGTGATTSTVATRPTAGCGVGFKLFPPVLFVEVGLMGPQANRSYLSGYVSVDADVPLYRTHAVYLPMAIVGYSRLFETGHALDYGLALAMPRFGKKQGYLDSMRIELRDYWTFANPAQHNVMLRVGWMGPSMD